MSGNASFPCIAFVTLIACGDNTKVCSPEHQREGIRIPGCGAALVFAARDTADLLPSQQEVDRYLERWQLVISAEPILAPRLPQRYRRNHGYNIHTTNPTFIEAWTQGVLETGDVELDRIFVRLGATLDRPAREDGASYRASLTIPHYFNEEFLAAMLLERSSMLNEPAVWPRDDGTWIWLDTDERAGHDDATAKIDFLFGWGDCFVGCFGFRRLEVFVPPDGPATVYDLGGDPLPPGWSLSPNTKPPP